MTPERWQQVEAIFDEAVELDRVRRRAYLDEACRGDDDLRQAVEALLAADAMAPSFLDDGAAAMAEPVLSEVGLALAPADAGQRLGAYRLVREIGQGGMSVVYLAERDDGLFAQRVAVKLMQPFGTAPEERARRFRTERQILASLSHPHIAKVFEGGVTEGGWPYLVMEYIEGEALTDYCQRCGLGLAERLDLFHQVCDAVQYAHQNLVVHRDLKPSNILVTELEGGAPCVKLLDFGIAKLLEGDGTRQPLATRLATQTGLRMLTPEYAAPEQVRGDTVTTASDVYALGVVLYELLAGERPYRLTGKTPAVIERIICDETPTKPSTVAAEAEVEWTSRLRGDLDTIVLKALRKEPSVRYGSVRELAEDLTRYRRGHPVHARPATLTYQARKFVRRHWVGVGMATGVVLLLLAFIAVLLRQQALTEQERDEKEREAARANEVADFAISLFEAGDPDVAQGRVITVEDLVDLGIARIGTLDEYPESQTTMMDVMGRVSFNVGDYARADSLHRLALTRQEVMYGPSDPSLAEPLYNLGRVLQLQDSLVQAKKRFERAYQLQVEAYGESSPQTHKYLNGLAFAHLTLGDPEQVVALAREALERFAGEEETAETVESRYILARGLDYGGQHAEAEGLFRDVLAWRENVLGTTHSKTAETMFELGDCLENQKKWDEAAALYERVLEVNARLYGDMHAEVGHAVYALASVQYEQGRKEEALKTYRQAALIYDDYLPEGNPWRAYPLIRMGRILVEQQRYSEAKRLFRTGIEICEKSPSSALRALAYAKNGMGAVLTAEGDYERAEDILLASYESLKGDDRYRLWTVESLEYLIDLYNEWDRPDESLSYRRELQELTKAE